MVARETSRPILSVMSHVASDAAYLVQTEFRLARAEVGEKVSTLFSAGAWLAIGASFLIAGLVVLLFDVSLWLTALAGMSQEWSLLLVAVVALVVGGGVAMVGVDRMKGSALVPNRALEQMREDYAVAKEHVR